MRKPYLLVLLDAIVLILSCAQARTQYVSQILSYKQKSKLALPPHLFPLFFNHRTVGQSRNKIRQKVISVFLKYFLY